MSLSFRWLNRHVFATSAALRFRRSVPFRRTVAAMPLVQPERAALGLGGRELAVAAAPSRKRQRRVRGRVIIQFAANDPVQLADAAELVQPPIPPHRRRNAARSARTCRARSWRSRTRCRGPSQIPEPQRGVHSPPAPSRKRQRRVRGRVIIQFAANDPPGKPTFADNLQEM
jgi:hypothetical protein